MGWAYSVDYGMGLQCRLWVIITFCMRYKLLMTCVHWISETSLTSIDQNALVDTIVEVGTAPLGNDVMQIPSYSFDK